MQETTLNPPNQADSLAHLPNVNLWLAALYSQASENNSSPINLNSNLKNCDSLKNLESKIGYTFKNKSYLITALTHSTFNYEFSDFPSSERLEFLGDSLVNFLTAKILFQRYSQISEGELSRLRGALVNEHSLALLAKSIDLGENLLLGKGEFKNNGQNKESILADSFEALMGAIYFDSEEKTHVLEEVFLSIIKSHQKDSDFFSLENLTQFDFKTKLQELSMALFQKLPIYKSTEVQNGFLVELWIDDKKCAEMIGPSKKKCEKELARIVLDEKRYQ